MLVQFLLAPITFDLSPPLCSRMGLLTYVEVKTLGSAQSNQMAARVDTAFAVPAVVSVAGGLADSAQRLPESSKRLTTDQITPKVPLRFLRFGRVPRMSPALIVQRRLHRLQMS